MKNVLLSSLISMFIASGAWAQAGSGTASSGGASGGASAGASGGASDAWAIQRRKPWDGSSRPHPSVRRRPVRLTVSRCKALHTDHTDTCPDWSDMIRSIDCCFDALLCSGQI